MRGFIGRGRWPEYGGVVAWVSIDDGCTGCSRPRARPSHMVENHSMHGVATKAASPRRKTRHSPGCARVCSPLTVRSRLSTPTATATATKQPETTTAILAYVPDSTHRRISTSETTMYATASRRALGSLIPPKIASPAAVVCPLCPASPSPHLLHFLFAHSHPAVPRPERSPLSASTASCPRVPSPLRKSRRG